MQFDNSLNMKENPTNTYPHTNKSIKINYHSSSKSALIIISTMAISISTALYLFSALLITTPITATPRFSVVIDGGSTGTRLHVFEYRIEDGEPTFEFGPRGLGSMRVNPGLSSYAEVPDRAGESLVNLLEFAKERVPRKYRGETEIRLMATAGLRLLDVRLQESILASCRRVLGSSGFKFRDDWASVISGSDEGLYAWVIANHALGSLGGDPRKTTGIIELGGASVQVTFVSSKQLPAEFSRTFKYGNVTYNLYSQSMLQFGQNAASDSVRELLVSSSSIKAAAGEASSTDSFIDPCSPKGYVHDAITKNSPVPSGEPTYFLQSWGNFSDCRNAASMLLKRKTEECASTQLCSMGSSSLFPLKLDGKFLATENFFYTSKVVVVVALACSLLLPIILMSIFSKLLSVSISPLIFVSFGGQFFGLTQKVHLADLMEAGTKFCESEWSSLREQHPTKRKEDLRRYCFASAYIVALLHDHLGIQMEDERIRYTNNVKKIPLDWALGAFILQTTAANSSVEVVECRGQGITDLLNEECCVPMLLLLATSFLFFLTWSLSKWKKPCLKTIYDLEKGRYIVTRINR